MKTIKTSTKIIIIISKIYGNAECITKTKKMSTKICSKSFQILCKQFEKSFFGLFICRKIESMILNM